MAITRRDLLKAASVGSALLASTPTSDAQLRERLRAPQGWVVGQMTGAEALVETLIGKGCDVRVLDPNIVMARLRGANRQYIENEIPHIASLLCDSAEELIDHADVLVIGAKCAEAAGVLAAVRPDQAVVDLTRGAVNAPGAIREGPVWAAS